LLFKDFSHTRKQFLRCGRYHTSGKKCLYSACRKSALHPKTQEPREPLRFAGLLISWLTWSGQCINAFSNIKIIINKVKDPQIPNTTLSYVSNSLILAIMVKTPLRSPLYCSILFTSLSSRFLFPASALYSYLILNTSDGSAAFPLCVLRRKLQIKTQQSKTKPEPKQKQAENK